MPNKLTASQLHENVPPGWYYNSVRTNFIQRYVHTRRFTEVGNLVEPNTKRILDIGCADGAFTKVILDNSKAQEIIAIDVLRSNIDWAKKHWKKEKEIRFEIGDAHKLNFKEITFDAVFALEVLEHVFDPKEVLTQIKRVLKKGGYAVFLVPAETLLFKVVWFFWTKYYKGRIWDGTHLHAYKNSYLIKLAKEVGFQIEVDKKIIFGTLHLIKVRKN
jgi:2-polyprenyl-3-methyl-5-hydroxy-6-metoxy-1,4-benzoquinol methylase